MDCRLIFYTVIFQLVTALCLGCMEPFPHYLKEMDETDGPGTEVLTMLEPPTSSSPPSNWTVSVTSPLTNASYLEGFFSIVQDGSVPSHWKIVLAKAVDIELIRKDTNLVLSDLILNIQCSTADTNSVLRYERTIVIRAISEAVPMFDDPLPVFNVTEDSAVGKTVVRLMNYVSDSDVQNNGQLSDIRRFTTQPFVSYDGVLYGDDQFGVTAAGNVLLLRGLDYENGGTSFGLNVTVEDTGGLKSWSIIRIDVINTNDNHPVFVYTTSKGEPQQVAEYTATVEDFYTGPITLYPGPIQARDPDNDEISYYIKTGFPNDYSSYISLDASQAAVHLTKPVNSSEISHFTLIIEARDGPELTSSGEPNTQTHRTTASLLLFISGRDAASTSGVDPRSGTSSTSSSSTIASVNTDALFISVIVLSTLSLLLIVAVIVLCCKMKRMKRRGRRNEKFPGGGGGGGGSVDRCNTLVDRKPSDWSVQMRPVERGDSEKAFMRSLSRSTPYSNDGFVDDSRLSSSTDDVFVTGIAPYPSHSNIVHTQQNKQNNFNNNNNNNNNNHTNINNNNNNNNNNKIRALGIDHDDVISRGIMPYDEGNPGASSVGIDSMTVARHSATTLPRNAPLTLNTQPPPPPPAAFASATTTTATTAPPPSSSLLTSQTSTNVTSTAAKHHHHHTPLSGNTNNMWNSFDSLDLLTSVTPMPSTEDDTRPIRIMHNNNNSNNNSKNNNNIKTPRVANNTNVTGTSRSLTSSEVMNELDQIIFNENRYYSPDNGEKVTHFTNESTTDDHLHQQQYNNNNNSRQNNICPGDTDEEEGVTSFVRDAVDFGVTPFDPDTADTGTGTATTKSFLFPGPQSLQSPASPGSPSGGNPFKNDPVLNSADVYYRQNNDTPQTKK